MGPQLAVAGVGTSKFSVGTNGAIHAIMFSSLTQVLHLFTTSSCPRRPHHQFSHCNYFSIPYVLSQHFRYFWFISSHFFSIFLIQVHCGSAFEPGASWLPRYCTPPVCVPDVIRGLAVWPGYSGPWTPIQHMNNDRFILNNKQYSKKNTYPYVYVCMHRNTIKQI